MVVRNLPGPQLSRWDRQELKCHMFGTAPCCKSNAPVISPDTREAPNIRLSPLCWLVYFQPLCVMLVRWFMLCSCTSAWTDSVLGCGWRTSMRSRAEVRWPFHRDFRLFVFLTPYLVYSINAWNNSVKDSSCGFFLTCFPLLSDVYESKHIWILIILLVGIQSTGNFVCFECCYWHEYPLL